MRCSRSRQTAEPSGTQDAAFNPLRVLFCMYLHMHSCRGLHGNPATCCSLPCELAGLPHKPLVAGPCVQMQWLLLWPCTCAKQTAAWRWGRVLQPAMSHSQHSHQDLLPYQPATSSALMWAPATQVRASP